MASGSDQPGPVAEFSIPARVLRTLTGAADIRYDRCQLHHIIWWQHGGRTDLDNLLPVCSIHHAKIHDDGWVIELGPNRELNLRLPDARIHTTGPPSRRTAA